MARLLATRPRTSAPWLLAAAALSVGSWAPVLWAGPAPVPPAPARASASSPSQVLATMVAGGDGQVSLPPPRGVLSPEGDRTLAPYFQVAGGDPKVERLPLERTSADVTIVGVIAKVTVSQVYVNRGRAPIEAVYVFPASTRAAVHGMRMTIGQRVLVAKIERRSVARQEYEQARQEGKRASLLEQERPNVFTMNVANVMPGDRIAVELEYSEMLVPDEGIYELVYPTVVGPRYGGGADPKKDRWIANPYLPPGAAGDGPAVATFDIKARIDAGIDLKELSSPSHPVTVSYQGPRRAEVRLAEGTTPAGNRDFVLRYRLAGDRIETGVLLWEGEGSGGQPEKYFAVLLEPPPRPAASQVPPREYIFLLDVSGSMHGFPLETARTLMRKLLGNLRPIDSFNVVLFAGSSSTLAPGGSLPATAGNLARALALVDDQRGGGGTELLAGLRASYAIPRQPGHASRTVVVISDGFVGVEPQTFRFVRERAGEANLFAFGIGSSVNRGLIEGMARAGQGEPFVVLAPERAAEAAEKLRVYIEQPVLTGVQVSWNGFAATEVAPSRLPDLLARRPLVVFGKYQGPASGRIDVSGWQGAKAARFHQSIQVRPEDVRPQNAALRWLWARRWVDILDDERHMGGGQAAEQAITELGLGHRLLTSFTSFVAVDSQQVNPGGQAATVKQPLPLPQGVSGLAVGGGHQRHAGTIVRKGVASGVYGGSVEGAVAGGSVGGMVAGGGLSGLRARVAPSPATPPPMPMAASAPESLSNDAHREVRRQPRPPAKQAARSRAEEPPAAPRFDVRLLAVKATTGANPLVTRVRQALAGLAAGCLLPSGAAIELRLQVDGKGKVTGVDLVRGDARLLACLRKALLHLTSDTRAAGAGVSKGTVELRVAGP